MSSDLAISIAGLSKSYNIRHQAESHITMAEAMLARARHPLRRTTRERFWALRDVAFDVRRGEVLGLIGRNGAGKSTLLKLLSRITAPTAGKIDLYGRVGSLLEVGTGFHPELTGRENIYLNGTILGMRHKQIERRFDEIVDFAGVAQFLDTPVKRYSTGMSVRLAFSVAAHLETEILLVDEVLAVGDLEFQRKCLAVMRDVAAGGRTVLFVSHNLDAVRQLCTRAVLVAGGQVCLDGTVDHAIGGYLSDLLGPAETPVDNDPDRRRGSGELRFVSVDMINSAPLPVEPKIVRFTIERRRAYEGRYWVSAELFDDRGTLLVQCDSRVTGHWISASTKYRGELEIRQPWLRPGRYRLNLYICAAGILDWYEAAVWFDVAPILPYAFSASHDATATGVVFADFSYQALPTLAPEHKADRHALD